MSSINPFSEFEGLYSFLSGIENVVNQFNIENYNRLANSLSVASNITYAINEAVSRQANMLESLNYSIYERSAILDATKIQWEVLARIAETYKTPEIFNLEKALLQNNFAALQTFTDTLNVSQYIEAPNIALLKTANVFANATLPTGVATVLHDMHMCTAKVLSNSETVSYDVNSKLFFVEESPTDTANISETNILCSSLQLLSGIDEADLISFLNCLEKEPPFACNHTAGEKIEKIISNWDMIMDFDQQDYYHARALAENQCPYTEQDLRQAPRGVTWHGRFNYVGQSHYYFSDMPKGAIMEVKKHSKEQKVQIAHMKPSRPIRMIDLSTEIVTQNKFLEYCRFNPSPDQYPNIKREYLIPCYVANCCQRHGIEGIKYYGSKEYKNYVSWNDTYLTYVDSEICNM